MAHMPEDAHHSDGKRLLVPLNAPPAPKSSIRLSHARVVHAHEQGPHRRIEDFGMPPPQNLAELKARTLEQITELKKKKVEE